MSSNLLCILQGFHRIFFLPVHYLTLSLSDLPPEGSSGRRHAADSTGQEPGPEGWSCKGLYWRCAMYSPAWALHHLFRVSTITYGWIMIHKFACISLCQLFLKCVLKHSSVPALFPPCTDLITFYIISIVRMTKWARNKSTSYTSTSFIFKTPLKWAVVLQLRLVR